MLLTPSMVYMKTHNPLRSNVVENPVGYVNILKKKKKRRHGPWAVGIDPLSLNRAKCRRYLGILDVRDPWKESFCGVQHLGSVWHIRVLSSSETQNPLLDSITAHEIILRVCPAAVSTFYSSTCSHGYAQSCGSLSCMNCLAQLSIRFRRTLCNSVPFRAACKAETSGDTKNDLDPTMQLALTSATYFSWGIWRCSHVGTVTPHLRRYRV